MALPSRKHLWLDKEKHEYFMGDRRVPGVTTVIDAALNVYGRVDPQLLAQAQVLGRDVHTATELHDLGVLDPETVDPSVAPYLSAWQQFLSDKKPEILAVERLLYNTRMDVAGMGDRLLLLDDKFTILDIKSGVYDPWFRLQTAAYAAMVDDEALEWGKVRKRLTVCLQRTGRYTVHTHADAMDINYFIGCLNVYKFKRQYYPAKQPG